MLEIEPTFYTPVVRWKQGEYLAHSALDPEIAKFVLPHIVLPPPKESDPERGRVLTNEELICEHAARVGAHWSGRPCLLDTRFLGAALDASEAPAWLPALFDAVDRKRGRAIPVTDLSAQPGEVEGTARVLTKQRHGLALRVTLLDLADATLANWSGNMSLG